MGFRLGIGKLGTNIGTNSCNDNLPVSLLDTNWPWISDYCNDKSLNPTRKMIGLDEQYNDIHSCLQLP